MTFGTPMPRISEPRESPAVRRGRDLDTTHVSYSPSRGLIQRWRWTCSTSVAATIRWRFPPSSRRRSRLAMERQPLLDVRPRVPVVTDPYDGIVSSSSQP